jgi:phosphate butyryltransferase
MAITKLDQIIEAAKKRDKKRLVVAYGQDINTLNAVNEAANYGFVDITLIGDENIIKERCAEANIDAENFNIIHEADEMTAGKKAVAYVNEGNADFIMKGLISTDKYLKCILDKENGLMPKGKKSVLTHVMVVEAPSYHKLMIASDCAFIPEPDINQKIAIANYLISTARKLEIERPKVAVIAFTEKANPKIESCNHAAILSKMADRGQIKNADIDGPLALDVAINMEAVKIKGIKSEVAGQADCLLFPNLDAGNVYYKSMTKLVKAHAAAIVVGARVPAILPSRGDSDKSKLYSIALAALNA